MEYYFTHSSVVKHTLGPQCKNRRSPEIGNQIFIPLSGLYDAYIVSRKITRELQITTTHYNMTL